MGGKCVACGTWAIKGEFAHVPQDWEKGRVASAGDKHKREEVERSVEEEVSV